MAKAFDAPIWLQDYIKFSLQMCLHVCMHACTTYSYMYNCITA